MRERITKLLGFIVGLVVTVAALFLVTAWDIRPIDLAVLFIFVVGVGVGFWIASALHA